MTVLGRIFHQSCERETTLGKAAAGLAVGGVAGAGLTGVACLMGGPLAIIVFLFALPIWFGGLFLIAAPGWWVLHRLGARCQQAAMIYGGGLTYAVCVAYVWLDGPRPFELQVLWSLPMFGLAAIGVSVGWVVAKVAYEPVRP